MSAHPQTELAPLAALGALDGQDLSDFEAHVPACAACRAEVAAHEAVAARIPLALDPLPPAPRVRDLVLEPARRGRTGRRPWAAQAAAAAVVLLALAAAVGWVQAMATRRQVRELEARFQGAEAMVNELQRVAAEDRALRDLLVHPTARVTPLGGLAATPLAHGRMVWKPDTLEAVLLTLGLAPAPPGRAYTVWVIGAASPVPAGTFQVDAEGKAVVRLPAMRDTAEARTFAVTLEPEAGGPAPTGPMVLSGTVS